jgi:hypothetical protein
MKRRKRTALQKEVGAVLKRIRRAPARGKTLTPNRLPDRITARSRRKVATQYYMLIIGHLHDFSTEFLRDRVLVPIKILGRCEE